jgi:alkanesulfonate monooxygenase SsuD/methylene tetrahydromethanopterin reductase-like flavin-dependent oxidoreductase (luciferase family)
MHAGLYLNPQTPGPAADRHLIEACVDHTRLAERYGYRAVWLTEHAFTGYNAFSDPLVFGSHLAAVAPRLYLGLSIAVAALHHPIRFATQAALIDNLTGGRFVCGIGSGIGPDEFAGYGLAPVQKYELLENWTRIVTEAWTHRQQDPPYVYETPWWRGRIDGRIIPAPLQRPHPPLARATLTPEVARAQGRQGLPLLLSLIAGTGELLWNTYLEGLAESDLSQAQRERALEWSSFAQQVYISDGADPAAEVWPYATTYLSKGVRANLGIDRVPETDWQRRKAGYRRGLMLAGNPQQVLDKLCPWAERGMRHILVWAMFGHMPPERAAETIQRFAEEVLPHLERIKRPL